MSPLYDLKMCVFTRIYNSIDYFFLKKVLGREAGTQSPMQVRALPGMRGGGLSRRRVGGKG